MDIMKKTKRIFAVGVMFLVCLFFTGKAANYTLSVNAAAKAGSWNKFYERGVALDHMYTVISSAYGRNASNALQKAHKEAGFTYVRGHGIFDDDVDVYKGPGNYNWTNVDKIYDSIVAAGMKPIVELGFMPKALAASSTLIGLWYNGVSGSGCAPKNWTDWENLVKAFIAHLETRYGAEEVRNNWFVEVWNEPNWMYSCGGQEAGYQTLYQHSAIAVKAQDSLIRIGGPAESGPSGPSAIPKLIKTCKSGGYKLDFISYHYYSSDGDVNQSNDANKQNAYLKQVRTLCKDNGFTGLVLCTEYGPSAKNNILWRDSEMGASYAAKVVYLLNSNDTLTMPPPYSFGWWALSDIYEENNMTNASPAFAGCFGLLTRGIAGAQASWDIAKPSFNGFKLLHKLGDIRLSCTGGTTASPGVNAIATISKTGDTISILVFSHVDNTNGNSSTVDNVSLSVSGIPFTKSMVEHWVVDANHSNSYKAWTAMQSPKNPSASQYATIAQAAQLDHYDSTGTQTISGGVFSKTFTQNYYSVGLIQITNANATSMKEKNQHIAYVLPSIAYNRRNVTVNANATDYSSVKVFNMNGKKVYENKKTMGNYAMTLPLLSAGSYILEVSGQNMKLTKTIMIMQ